MGGKGQGMEEARGGKGGKRREKGRGTLPTSGAMGIMAE